MIKERLRAFHNGDWLQLLEEATAKRLATGAGDLDDHEADDNNDDESELNRSAREAVRLTRLNERSRAMSRLTSSGIAPPSKQVAEMLRMEITGGAVLSSSPPGIGFDWRSANLPRCTLDHVALRRRLREAKRGSSPSLSGWRYEFLQLTLRSQQSFRKLATVAELLANAEAPSDLVMGMMLNPLTAKKKPGNRVRPLAAPDALRRLVAGTLCASNKERFRADLAPVEHAVDIPGGT